VERHLESCRACRAGVFQLEETLREFHGAMRQSSVGQMDAGFRNREPRTRPLVTLGRCAAVALTLVVIVGFSALHLPNKESSTAISDAALLEQIDAEVSQIVPPQLEPLLPQMRRDDPRGH
jgi:anti-sigma factor RsiW